MTLPAGGLPEVFIRNGATSRVAVSVTSPGSGKPVTTATATLDGTPLEWVAEQGVLRGWFLPATDAPFTLRVSAGGATFTVTGRQGSTFPHLVTPPQERLFTSPPAWRQDVLRTEPTLVSWQGNLPGTGFRSAVAVMSAEGDLRWPGPAELLVLPEGSRRQATVPAGAVAAAPGDSVMHVLAGTVETLPIVGAAEGSSLTVGTFHASPVDLIERSRGPLLALELDRSRATLGTQRELQLRVSGLFTELGLDKQDYTARATWSSDAPEVVSVTAPGLITGVSAGTARVTATFGALSVSVLVTVPAAAPAPAPDQAVAFQVDAAHTGRARLAAPLVLPAAPAWSVELPGPIAYPLIARGKVFVIAPHPQSGPTLHAYDAKTGELRWGPVRFAANEHRVAHALDGDTLVTTSDAGLVRGLSADTGEQRWSLDLREQVQDVWVFHSAPTASRGIAYVLGGGVAYTLSAIDVLTGQLLWSAPQLPGDAAGGVAVSDENAFITGARQYIAVDALSGARAWRYSGPGTGSTGYTPAYFDGKVFVRDTANPFSSVHDARTGVRAGPPGAAEGQPSGLPAVLPISAFSEGRRFEVNQGTLYAIDLASHRVLWSFAPAETPVSAPLVVDQTVFVTASTGAVFGVDARDGRQVWRGTAGTTAVAPNDRNTSVPPTGMNVGEGLLVVPAGTSLTAFRLLGP
jgi:outer membrane protein assembly factor BamB